MKPWDIYTFDFPDIGAHPAVILGTPERTAAKPKLNVLLCQSKRATRRAEINEIILDAEDGLDWETLCKCDLVYVVNREMLKNKRGEVTVERRRQMAEKLIRSLGLAGL